MKTYRIIIVENDEDEQMFMEEAFQSSSDFTLLAITRNGDTLVEWLEGHPDQLPDVILSDLNMPGKNGYDIIAEMRDTPAYASIPVVITSTSSTPSIIERCMQTGAAAYIVKPETFIAYASYVEKVKKLLEEKRIIK